MKLLSVCVLLGAAVLAQAVIEEEPTPRQKFLLGVVRTQVISTATTTTIGVAANTCINQMGTTTCSGRKKRRALPTLQSQADSDAVYSSLNGEEPAAAEAEATDDDSVRLVVWSTTTTMLTFTSSTTQSGTTLSLSYACTASGMNTFSACGCLFNFTICGKCLREKLLRDETSKIL